MNTGPIVPLLFPNNATNSPVGGNTGQNAAANTPFFRLILALLATAQNQEEAVNTGTPLGLFGTQQAISPPENFSDQEIKQESSDISVQEAGVLGVLISLGQNCLQSDPLQAHALPVQALPPVNVESCLLQNVSQTDMPGPQFTAFFPGLEEKIGQSLNQDGSVCIAEVSVSKTIKPLLDFITGNHLDYTEISGLMGCEPDTGKTGNPPAVMTGIKVPVESNIPFLNQPVQIWGDLGEELNLVPGQQKGLQEKVAETAEVQYQSEKPVLKKDVAKQQVLRVKTQLPLKVDTDNVGNSALPVNLREFPKVDAFLPMKPEDGQLGEAAAREVIKQVVDKAHLIVGKNVASLKLQLKPEFLGNLKLSISVEHGLVHARFTAENAAVANLIEAHLPELQHALADRGISWQQVSVSVDAQAHSQGFAHTQYEGRGSPQPNLYTFSGDSSGKAEPGELQAASYLRDSGAVDYLV